MLFNSFAFLFVYLPLVLAGYWMAGRFAGRSAAVVWLAAASVVFYAMAEPWHAAIMAGSILFNFACGIRLAATGSRTLLAFAVAANLVLLGVFKYADFFASNLAAATGIDIALLRIALPAGISFYTFTQIAFLADAARGEVRELNFARYVLFVTFFPHLIAGPIIHHREMMPQFARVRLGLGATNLAVGLSIFAVGLGKKLLLADNIAPFATPVFAAADAGATPTFFEAWAATLAYALRLYFDFSGYSDMAIGLSRMFGIRLPVNFHSPYKASSVADFWRRWHMTLSRFLRDYLYIPLGGSRHGVGRHIAALFATMVLGGFWHGASWNFVLWGALHGALLALNHLWRHFAPAAAKHMIAPIGMPLTFVCVVLAWVPFAAETLGGTARMYAALAAFDGVTFPTAAAGKIGALAPTLEALGIRFAGANIVTLEDWRNAGIPVVAAGLLVVWLLPNTQQIFGRYRPILGVYRGDLQALKTRFAWRPNPLWAACLAVWAAASLLSLQRVSEFIYFRF
jgi:alginate O-acetyltransferase complex protein AlgI